MIKSDQLSELYEKLLVAEAAKSDLTNVKNDVVGNLKKEDELFGETPDLVDVPKKAKIKEGPSYKISTSSETAPQATNSTHIFKGTKPAESEEGEEASEVKGTRVTPKPEKTKESETEENEKSHEDSDLSSENNPKKDKYNYKQESFTMNAFENLFKKTLMEQELEDTTPAVAETEVPSDDLSAEDSVESPESSDADESVEDEGDLISDLKELQDKLSAILSKLEGATEENDMSEEEEEAEGEEEYSDEDFESEFGSEEVEGEEEVKKESIDKPKLLGDKKKKLLGKDNKVGNIRPKGGKAHPGNFKNDPKPKALSTTVKGKSEVKSSVSKGDFIK